jgi:branched-subunit amino acid transport protein
MEIKTFFLYLLVMAGVTYLVRMLPLVFCRKKIRSRFIKSFLYYIPYTVLSVMTFPAIFYSTSSVMSAIVGTVIALTVAFMNKSMVIVAALSSLGVFVTELILRTI